MMSVSSRTPRVSSLSIIAFRLRSVTSGATIFSLLSPSLIISAREGMPLLPLVFTVPAGVLDMSNCCSADKVPDFGYVLAK